MDPIVTAAQQETFDRYFAILLLADAAEEAGDIRKRLDLLTSALRVLCDGVTAGVLLREDGPMLAEMVALCDEVEKLRALLGTLGATEVRGGAA